MTRLRIDEHLASRVHWKAVRGWLQCAAVVIVLLAFTQFVLPGSRGSTTRGTPAAILFTGLVTGLVGSLTAAGLILVYRTARIINFAQTAIGVAGATLVFDFVQLTAVPFPIAFAFGMALSGLVGLAFEVAVVRRFFNASRLVLTIATIAAGSMIAALGPMIVRTLPFIPYRSASAGQITGSSPITELLPFAGFRFHVGSMDVSFGFAEVFAIQLTLASLALLAAFFRFSKSGVAVRALAENSERASLLGISVGTVSMIVWTIAGLLAGASAIGTGAVLSPAQATGIAPTLLLPALAAAVVARFSSLRIAMFVSVLYGMLDQAVRWSLPDDVALLNVVLLAVIGGGLLAQPSRPSRSEEGAGASWQAVEEQRPIPKQLTKVTSVRAARIGVLAAIAVVAGAYPFFVGTGATVLGGNVALISIVVLSLVVLTGWAGHVSLGQFGFAAVGAVVGGALTARAGVPFWIAIVIAPAVTGAIAGLIGIPALRIRGPFLAVSTLAFGLAATGVLFNERYFGWLLPDAVERPTFLFIDFEAERNMYYLCVACLALAVVAVANLRRSRLGRTLIALRDNEANAQAFSIDPTRVKLMAFLISGALAGFAGAVMAHQGRGVNAASFAPEASISVFLFAVFGGVSSVAGAMLGSLYYNLVGFFSFSNPVLNILFKTSGQMFVLILLFVAPGGLIAIVNRFRDGVLRIVAQRRRIVVPSLFADYDPEALERRLVPLAPPSALEGLAALPNGDEWTVSSGLYGVDAHPHGDLDRGAGRQRAKEAAAFGAAAARVSEADAPAEVVGGSR